LDRSDGENVRKKYSFIPHVHKLFNNVEQNIIIIKTLIYCMFLYWYNIS